MALLPPTPNGVPPGHSYWNDWYEKLRYLINSAISNHNDLQNIQGGTTTERYHLTNAQHTTLSSLGDSYVTGAWTPTIIGTTAAGVGTYTVQSGEYTRIGNVVHLFGAVTWTAHTGTGNMRIANLPIAANKSGPLAARFSNITYTGTQAYVATLTGTTQLQCAQFSSGAAASDIPIDTAGSIIIQGIYFV